MATESKNGMKNLHLGIMLVVEKLGVSCLIGEPGKSRNNIICLPRKKLVLLADGDSVMCAPYYRDKPKYTLIRALTSQVLLPGDQITFTLPEQLRDESYVTITPRQSTQLWLKPTIVNPHLE